ncbi:MAG: hypothetical protein JW942_05265 [Opitutales bacterium]|nr:hypothetical protein [Opitutales bacterium]
MFTLGKIALSAAFVAVAAQLGAVTIEKVGTRNFSEEDLTSLREYLGAGEQTGGRCYLRTDPSQKAGRYFIVDTDEPLSSLPADGKVVLELVMAKDGQATTIELALADSIGTKGQVLYLGLTDKLRDEDILAWRISFRDASNKVLSQSHSFLWEMPEE